MIRKLLIMTDAVNWELHNQPLNQRFPVVKYKGTLNWLKQIREDEWNMSGESGENLWLICGWDENGSFSFTSRLSALLIQSNGWLMRETSASRTLFGGQFTVSASLIKQNNLAWYRDASLKFPWKPTPFISWSLSHAESPNLHRL